MIFFLVDNNLMFNFEADEHHNLYQASPNDLGWSMMWHDDGRSGGEGGTGASGKVGGFWLCWIDCAYIRYSSFVYNEMNTFWFIIHVFLFSTSDNTSNYHGCMKCWVIIITIMIG